MLYQIINPLRFIVTHKKTYTHPIVLIAMVQQPVLVFVSSTKALIRVLLDDHVTTYDIRQAVAHCRNKKVLSTR